MALKGKAKADYQRVYMAKRRLDPLFKEQYKSIYRRRNGCCCEVCGFNKTTDIHHEGRNKEEHELCPNCHALITRRLLTLEDLLKKHPDVRPTTKILGLKMQGNRILGVERSSVVNAQPRNTPDPYNTPEIDADGHQIPEY